MKFTSVLTALLAATFSSAASAEECAGTPGPGRIKLQVEATALRNGAGEVAFTVYGSDASKFLARGGKLLRVRTPATSPVTNACFWLPPGRYALALYHDENADHDFNRVLFLPKEGFGFSNDASTTAGLPRFKDVVFTLPAEGATVKIRMRYRR
jgi:uncharacterized protein (DUF2141 family)